MAQSLAGSTSAVLSTMDLLVSRWCPAGGAGMVTMAKQKGLLASCSLGFSSPRREATCCASWLEPPIEESLAIWRQLLGAYAVGSWLKLQTNRCHAPDFCWATRLALGLLWASLGANRWQRPLCSSLHPGEMNLDKLRALIFVQAARAGWQGALAPTSANGTDGLPAAPHGTSAAP